MESILTSVKEFLGPGADDTHFDPQIIMHINSVFADLEQLGVGPSGGFAIEDDTSVWTEYLPKDSKKFESVKSYIFLRVKLLFDPPLNAAVLESMQKQADKWEWRLNHAAETTI
jgi:hypothetical protein